MSPRHTLDDGHDSALLDSRRALEAIGVDTAKELGLQVHLVERVDGLVIVGLDLSCKRQEKNVSLGFFIVALPECSWEKPMFCENVPRQ